MIKYYVINNFVLSINEIIKQIKKYCEFDYKLSNDNNTINWYMKIDKKADLAEEIYDTDTNTDFIPNELNETIKAELSRYIDDIKLHCINLKWISHYCDILVYQISKYETIINVNNKDSINNIHQEVEKLNEFFTDYKNPRNNNRQYGGKKTIRKRISKRSVNKKILN
jgi:hypothetical protein